MLTLERCEEVLKEHNEKMSREEVKQLREYLYFLANLQVENENNEKNNESDECDIVL